MPKLLGVVCLSTFGIVLGLACQRYSHESDPRLYYEYVVGLGNITRQCAKCTLFDQLTCLCSMIESSPLCLASGQCNIEANFTLESDFSETSGNNLYVEVQNVSVQNGAALFSGNGFLNIYRFAADDFKQAVVIRVMFKSIPTSKKEVNTKALVTNCLLSSDQGASIGIFLTSSYIKKDNKVIFWAETTTASANISVMFIPGEFNEVIYIYDGENLTGVVNGVKAQTSLNGNIKIRQRGIILGAGCNTPNFNGEMKNFELYKCQPSFSDQYRL